VIQARSWSGSILFRTAKRFKQYLTEGFMLETTKPLKLLPRTFSVETLFVSVFYHEGSVHEHWFPGTHSQPPFLICPYLELTGHVGKTKTGQLSVFITEDFELLSPCLHAIPTRSGLKDPEKRFRNRHLDFLVNRDGLDVLRKRTQVFNICAF
jgi:hypothetical protein